MNPDENFSEKVLSDFGSGEQFLSNEQVTTFFGTLADLGQGHWVPTNRAGERPGSREAGEKALSRLETQLKRPPSLETVDSLFGTISADFRSKSREIWWSWFFQLTVF